MPTHPESLDRMLAAGNGPDPDEVGGHLDRALATEVAFIDPSVETRCIDEFEANVHEVHRRIRSGHRLRADERTSGVDSHHQLCRCSWRISRDGEVLLPGFDVSEVHEDGWVAQVLAFFGRCQSATDAGCHGSA